jgi:hypothetical protein
MRITFETGRKINLIKAVRTTHKLGLKEAKDLVEQGCYTTDPFALAYLARCIPNWIADCSGDLKVTFDATVPGHGFALPGEPIGGVAVSSLASIPSPASPNNLDFEAFRQNTQSILNDHKDTLGYVSATINSHQTEIANQIAKSNTQEAEIESLKTAIAVLERKFATVNSDETAW